MPIFNAFLAGARAQQAQENFDRLTQLGLQGIAQNAPIQAAIRAKEAERQAQLLAEAERQQRLQELSLKNRQQLELEKIKQGNRVGLEEVKSELGARRDAIKAASVATERAKDRAQSEAHFRARESRLKKAEEEDRKARQKEFGLKEASLKARLKQFKKEFSLKEHTFEELKRAHRFIEDTKAEKLSLLRDKASREVEKAKLDAEDRVLKREIFKKQIALMEKKLNIKLDRLDFNRILTTLLDPNSTYLFDPEAASDLIRRAIEFKKEFDQRNGGAEAKTSPFPEDRVNFNPQRFPEAPPIPQEKLVKGVARHAASEAGDIISEAVSTKDLSTLTTQELRDSRIDPDIRLEEIKRRLKNIDNLVTKRDVSRQSSFAERSAESVISNASFPEEPTNIIDLPTIPLQDIQKELSKKNILTDKNIILTRLLNTGKALVMPNGDLAAKDSDVAEVLLRNGYDPYKTLADGTVLLHFVGKEDVLGEFLAYNKALATNVALTPLKLLHFVTGNAAALEDVTGKGLEKIVGQDINTKKPSLFGKITENLKNLDDSIFQVINGGSLPELSRATDVLLNELKQLGDLAKKTTGKDFINNETIKGIIGTPLSGESTEFATLFAPVTLLAEATTGRPTFGGPIIPKAVPLFGGLPLTDTAIMLVMGAAAHQAFKGKKPGLSFDETLRKHGLSPDPERLKNIWLDPAFNERLNQLNIITGTNLENFLSVDQILKLEKSPQGQRALAAFVKSASDAWIKTEDLPKSVDAAILRTMDILSEKKEVKSEEKIIRGVTDQVLRRKTQKSFENLENIINNREEDLPTVKVPAFGDTVKKELAEKAILDGDYSNAIRLGSKQDALKHFQSKVSLAIRSGDIGGAVKLAESFGKESRNAVKTLLMDHLMNQGFSFAKSRDLVVKQLNRLPVRERFRAVGVTVSEKALELVSSKSDISEALATLSSAATKQLLEKGKISLAIRLAKNFHSLISATVGKRKAKGKLSSEAARFLLWYEKRTGVKLGAELGKNLALLNDPSFRERLINDTESPLISAREHAKEVKIEARRINYLLERGQWGSVARDIKRIKSLQLRKATAKIISEIMHVTQALINGDIDVSHRLAQRIKNLRVRASVQAIIDDVSEAALKLPPEQQHNLAQQGNLQKVMVDTTRLISDIKEHGVQVANQLNGTPTGPTLENTRGLLGPQIPLLNHPDGLLTADTVFFDVKPMRKKKLADFARKADIIAKKGYSVVGKRTRSFIRSFIQHNQGKYDLYYHPLRENEPWIIAEKDNLEAKNVAKKRGYKQASSKFIFMGAEHVDVTKAIKKLNSTGVVRTNKKDVALSLFGSQEAEGYLYYNPDYVGVSGRSAYVFIKNFSSAASLEAAGYHRVVRPRDYYQPIKIAKQLEKGKIPEKDIEAAQKNHAVVLQSALAPIPYDFFIKAYGYTSRVIQSIFRFDYRQAHQATKDFIEENNLKLAKDPQEGFLALQKYKLPKIDLFIGDLSESERNRSFFTPINSPSFVIPTIQSAISRSHFKFVRAVNHLRLHAGSVLKHMQDPEAIFAKLKGQEAIVTRIGERRTVRNGITYIEPINRVGPRIELSLNDRIILEYIQELVDKITKDSKDFKDVKRENKFPKLLGIIETSRGKPFTDFYRALDTIAAFALRKRYLETMIKEARQSIPELYSSKRLYAKEYLDLIEKGPAISKVERLIRDVATRGFIWGPSGLNFARKNMFQTITHDFASNPKAFMQTVITLLRDRKAFKERSKQLGFLKNFHHIIDLSDELENKDIRVESLKKLDEAMWFAAEGTEGYNRGFSGHVGLYDGLAKGLSGEALIDHAYRWIADHHYESGIIDRAPIFSKTVVGRAANFFSQYGIKDMEFVFKKLIGHKKGLVTMALAAWAVSEINSIVGLSSAYLAAGIPFSGAIGRTTGLAKVTPIFAGEEDLGISSVAISILGNLAENNWEEVGGTLMTMVPLAKAIYSAKQYWNVPDQNWVVTDTQRDSIASRTLKWLRQTHTIAFNESFRKIPYEKLKFGEWILRLMGFTTELQQYERIAQRALREAQEQQRADKGRILKEFPKKTWWKYYQTLLREYYEASKGAPANDKVRRQFMAIRRLPWYLKLDPLGWLVEVRKKQNKK